MERHFTPVAWSYNSSVYEVNVRQYTEEGTFKAFSEHLPRLQEMGIKVLWFMPITPISLKVRQGTLGSYYACSDYTSINPEFGNLNDFTELVKQAHGMGFKVIIDWVANHTGWDHVWTKSHPEYYKKDETGEFYDNNNWHDVIDLNYYDQGMRKAMIDAMAYWIKTCDIDGFRCDMAHLVPLDFWKEARINLDAIKPLFWLGETQDIPYLSVFDCCYTWDWMGWTHKFCNHETDLSKLKSILLHYENDYPAYTYRLFFTTNHDENTWNGTEYDKYGEAAKMLAVFSCTYDGLPLIYSGQEIPNRKRLKFFDKDPINWNEKIELHDFYKALLQARNMDPALAAGEGARPQFIDTSANDRILAFLRCNKDKKLIVVLNFSPNTDAISLHGLEEQGEFRNIFNGKKMIVGNGSSVVLDAWGYLVLESV